MVVAEKKEHEDPLDKIQKEEDADLAREYWRLKAKAYIAENNRTTERIRAETEALSRDVRHQKEATPGLGSVLMDILHSLWLQAGMDPGKFQKLAGRIDWETSAGHIYCGHTCVADAQKSECELLETYIPSYQSGKLVFELPAGEARFLQMEPHFPSATRFPPIAGLVFNATT